MKFKTGFPRYLQNFASFGHPDSLVRLTPRIAMTQQIAMYRARIMPVTKNLNRIKLEDNDFIVNSGLLKIVSHCKY